MTPKLAMDTAIAKSGGVHALAEKLHISRQAIEIWGMRGKVPVGRVFRIEALTGVSKHDLRPDIYPRERGVK